MKRYLLCFLLSSFLFSLHAQEDNFDEIIDQGMLLHEQGYFEDAIDCYQNALLFYPNAMFPYFQIACCYATMNKHKEALKLSDEVIKLDEIEETEDKVTFYIEALAMYITLVLGDD